MNEIDKVLLVTFVVLATGGGEAVGGVGVGSGLLGVMGDVTFSEVEGRGVILLSVVDRLYGKIELARFCRLLVAFEVTLIDSNSRGIGYI